jgi:hypothetical protein
MDRVQYLDLGSQQTAVVSGGRGARDGNDGGTGAPPSNTAPDNSNGFFQPLRWGIDSLYLSYPGELSPSMEGELKALKLQAQGKDYDAIKAQLKLGDHVFEVLDKSSGMFAFSLVDGAFLIRLSASRSKKLPMAYVQVRSGLLAHKAPSAIEDELRALLRLLGDVGAPKVSRVDLFADFASTLDMESWGREAWVTRAQSVHQYAEDTTFTGWSIGAGAALMARLYHKLLECRKTGKEYLLQLWHEAGWNSRDPVWRLEFEFRREVLAQLKLDTLPGVLEHLNGLWSYASTEWLKLCVPNEADKTRSRWPIHPLWVALASIDWEASGGPLSRTFTASRAPSQVWLGARALSLIASMGSVSGLDDFDAAGEELLRVASNALGNRYSLSGISTDQGFVELVKANNRKYNWCMNVPEAVEPEEGPRFSNPYYRGKQGL